MLDVKVRPIRTEDVEDVRKVGQKTWSDVAAKDAGHKVRYPLRPRQIVEAYMWKEPGGCLVADDGGDIVGSAFCHVWGRMGWVGPFEILPEMQNLGVGTQLMLECERYLFSRGCSIIGLETMPYFVRNLHFYLRLGYAPAETTFIMEKAKLGTGSGADVTVLEENELERVLPQITSLSSRLSKGLDYAGEVEMTVRRDLGRCLLLRRGRSLSGFGVVHTFYPQNEMDHATLRLLVVDPKASDGEASFRRILTAAEDVCAREGKARIFTRFSSRHTALYPIFLSSGYRLEGANLRLLKGDWKERVALHVSALAG